MHQCRRHRLLLGRIACTGELLWLDSCGSNELCVRWGPDHLKERGDTAFCQITLDICLLLLQLHQLHSLSLSLSHT